MSGPDERAEGEPKADPTAEPANEVKPAAPAKEADSAPRGPASYRSYLALLDFGTLPRSKAGWLVRAGVTAVAIIALCRQVGAVTRPLLSAKPPPSIPVTEIDDYRFRLPEHTRRAIFSELAAAELAERARAIQQNTWKGHVWSREDDRGYQERVAARAAAAKYRISLSQVYLVLDEGIRERWPGPDGNPLAATTPPLDIRSGSW